MLNLVASFWIADILSVIQAMNKSSIWWLYLILILYLSLNFVKFTVTILIPDKSGIWMVQKYQQMVKQISNGGLKTGQKLSVLWLKMSSIQMFLLIMLLGHLKTRQKSVQKVKC